jgi:hypothetical protein
VRIPDRLGSLKSSKMSNSPPGQASAAANVSTPVWTSGGIICPGAAKATALAASRPSTRRHATSHDDTPSGASLQSEHPNSIQQRSPSTHVRHVTWRVDEPAPPPYRSSSLSASRPRSPPPPFADGSVDTEHEDEMDPPSYSNEMFPPAYSAFPLATVGSYLDQRPARPGIESAVRRRHERWLAKILHSRRR